MYTMYANASNNTPSYIHTNSYRVQKVHPMGCKPSSIIHAFTIFIGARVA